MGISFTGATRSASTGAGEGEGGSNQLIVVPAPGLGKTNRIYRLFINASTADTITISDGFGTFYTRTAHSITLDYGEQGKLMATSNTALGITSRTAVLGVEATWFVE